MSLRHSIRDEIQSGRLSYQWTGNDLKKNERLRNKYKSSTLDTAPANTSRSAPGVHLGDGKHSDDYFYYVRVGKRGNALLFELCPETLGPPNLKDLEEEESRPSDDRPDRKEPATMGRWHPSCLKEILDTLGGEPMARVSQVHADFKRGILKDEDAWYQASYTALINRGSPTALQEFICVVAHAYSWLPINKAKACPTKTLFDELSVAINQVKKNIGNPTNRETLIRAAQRAISVSEFSVITVSKVLHFWDVKLAPMYDINVMRALTSISCTKRVNWFDKENGIRNYIYYWQLADQLIAASIKHKIGGLNYRQLDELLFQMGRVAIAESRSERLAGTRPTREKAGSGRRTALRIPKLIRSNVSKIAKAEALFLQNPARPKKAIIDLFVKDVLLTPKGASTYYYSFRKKFGK